MVMDDLIWLVGLFLGMVITTALVNWMKPKHRPRVRRLVVTFALYAAAIGATYGFSAIDRPTWSHTTMVGGEMLQALLLVTIAAMLVFSAALPAVGVQLPLIASDLVTGLGAIAAVFVILSRHGLDATNALVSGAVVSAVLAISLQSTLGNILGGVALQLDGSIREGDWLQLDNARVGRVRAVRWRHTIVELRDSSTVVVPNAQLLANNITLLGKRDGLRTPQRLSICFNVDFRFAPNQVCEVVTDAVRAAPLANVASDPPPIAVCTDLARDSREPFIAYAVRYSILDLDEEDATASRLRARIYSALRRNDIPLSMPAMFALAPTTNGQPDTRAQQDLAERVTILRSLSLFNTFTDDELDTLARSLNAVSFTAGERVMRQGAVARWLFVLARGTVEVRTNVDPDGPGGEPERPVYVSKLTAPDFFGEMGLMTGDPRAADIFAVTDVDCYRLGKDAFQNVLLARPKIAEELSERLALRRSELVTARDGVEAGTALRIRERDRILGALRGFFSLH